MDKNKLRQDFELPDCVDKWGWKYHHLGLPTTKKQVGEKYIEKFKLYTAGFSTSPYGIEWMRFEKGSCIYKKIQTEPHIAFVVENLDHELAIRDLKILTAPNPPSDNCRVAMVEHNGAIIELIEFGKK